MLSEAAIRRAGEALAAEARAPAKVILFGSYSSGAADSGSDLDLLVIEGEVDDRFAEAARLNQAIGRLGIPADVIVVSEQYVHEWGEVEGTMLHEALTRGRVLAELVA